MRRRLVIAVALPLLALWPAACREGGGEPILIGVAGPVSKANGRSMRLAVEMAVEEINRSGGVRGRPLQLVVMDDEGDVNQAIDIARQLRENPAVVAVIGHLNSSASLKAAPIYNLPRGASDSIRGAPVLQISPASSAPQLREAGDWTFRVTPTDLEFSPELARWAAGRLGLRRAAVIYANDDYGQGVRRTFEDAFRRNGGTVVSADPYLPAAVAEGTELDPFLVRGLQQRRADALVIGGQADEGLKIIAAARRLGYTGPILGSDGLTNVKDRGPIANGVFVSSAFLPDRPDTAAQRFVGEYRRRYDNELPDHRGAMAYDVVYLLRAGLEAVGPDRRRLRDWVAGRDTEREAHHGVSGNIVFDEKGDVKGKPVAIGVVRNGQLVTAR
ncbi:MAG TPA: ABC transporter substrate-binding protein [Longimicrobiaceae bacterium]|nr:ABC transporter substrate-binding protein [Longimicrobiaceae bacterium]